MPYTHPSKSSSKFLLGWFVLASFLLHGVVITLTDSTREKTVDINFSAPLTVTVVSSRSFNQSRLKQLPEQKPQQKRIHTTTYPLPVETEKGSANHKKKNKPVKLAENTKPPETPPVKPEKAITREVKREDVLTSTDTLKTKNIPLNDLHRKLQKSIRARFTYPRIARRMGWEGLVGISLHIDNDGSLKKVQVARSSGHKVLDENARKTIQSIGRIQVASNATILATDTEIEVLYKLTD